MTHYRIDSEQIGRLIDLTESLCFEESAHDRVQIAKTRIELVNEIKSQVINDCGDECPEFDGTHCNCEKYYGCVIRIAHDDQIVKHTKNKIGKELGGGGSSHQCSWLDDRDNGEGCPGKRNGHKSCDGCQDFDVDVWALRMVVEELIENGNG